MGIACVGVGHDSGVALEKEISIGLLWLVLLSGDAFARNRIGPGRAAVLGGSLHVFADPWADSCRGGLVEDFAVLAFDEVGMVGRGRCGVHGFSDFKHAAG